MINFYRFLSISLLLYLLLNSCSMPCTLHRFFKGSLCDTSGTYSFIEHFVVVRVDQLSESRVDSVDNVDANDIDDGCTDTLRNRTAKGWFQLCQCVAGRFVLVFLSVMFAARTHRSTKGLLVDYFFLVLFFGCRFASRHATRCSTAVQSRMFRATLRRFATQNAQRTIRIVRAC